MSHPPVTAHQPTPPDVSSAGPHHTAHRTTPPSALSVAAERRRQDFEDWRARGHGGGGGGVVVDGVNDG